MGLDSIELVMTVEDTFGIKIPNNECEQIGTVQQMADAVFEKIKIHPNEKCISQIVFYRIRQAFLELGNERLHVTPNTKIIDLLPTTDIQIHWEVLALKIGLKIPNLVSLDLDKNLNKEVRFLGFKIFDRTMPITEGTLRKFTDWVISLNHQELISIEQISSKYEVERIICGITEDRIGVPISEIELKHSFANDLGVD